MARKRAAEPWDRQRGESAPAHAAFLRYRSLGVTRSTDKIGHHGGTKGAPGRITKWCAEHAWVARAAAWDAFLQAKEDEATAKARAKEAAKWETRAQAQLERTHDIGVALVEAARAILAFPLTTTETRESTIDPENGAIVNVTVTNPAAWRLRDAATLAMQGTELSNAAIEAGTKSLDELDDAEIAAVSRLPLTRLTPSNSKPK
jgi:hypothetical protein